MNPYTLQVAEALVARAQVREFRTHEEIRAAVIANISQDPASAKGTCAVMLTIAEHVLEELRLATPTLWPSTAPPGALELGTLRCRPCPGGVMVFVGGAGAALDRASLEELAHYCERSAAFLLESGK